ncbi:MAG: 50S ribosomal protein L11 methyltransferase [Bacteroidetes bacterium]|nr:MAG: 50S ribosomal protein L11 methyltransferase [Bacteroidota bacterium]TAG94477.1 MAG: 50S ribosomal protein L11 methyltransferase [Bacteroidota bacterium]
MPYIQLTIKQLNAEQTEILVAELSMLEYDSFLEIENGVEAYIDENFFEEEKIKEIQKDYQQLFSFEYQFEKMPEQNWNATWEADYAPVEISDECRIIAYFHQPQNLPYEIIITPKMSFGTGHHDTTVLMSKFLLDLPRPLSKKVVDAGTGTGILAILSEKLGATDIFGFDIEEWSVINAQENTALNQCKYIKIEKGTIAEFDFLNDIDIFIANIQRNVLYDEMEKYAQKLKQNGVLLLSGFYEADKDYLVERAKQFGLKYQKHQIQNDWCGLMLIKH